MMKISWTTLRNEIIISNLKFVLRLKKMSIMFLYKWKIKTRKRAIMMKKVTGIAMFLITNSLKRR